MADEHDDGSTGRVFPTGTDRPSEASTRTASGPQHPDTGHDGATGSEPTLSERLATARERISDNASSDGRFVVACKDSGVRPDPVSAVSFAEYRAAERARDAATRYRDALRAVDDSLPEYDLVVSETADGSVDVTAVRESTDRRRANGLPATRETVTLSGDRRDEWLRIENAAVVHLAGPESLLDDELVSRQLQSKL